MSSPPRTETTLLLQSMGRGDAAAAEKLLPLVYDELHRRANQLMRGERAGHTLQPTGLIHEAFMRLVDQDVQAQSRQHFLRIAARAMRQVLVDHARSRGSQKRGGGQRGVTLDERAIAGPSDDVLAVDDALNRLAKFDPQLAQIVELRFYGELAHKEIADTLGISLRTVERGWRVARAWLAAAMAEEAS